MAFYDKRSKGTESHNKSKNPDMDVIILFTLGEKFRKYKNVRENKELFESGKHS